MVCQVCQVVVSGKVRYGDPWAVVRPLGQADSARVDLVAGRAGRGRARQGWAGLDRAGQQNGSYRTQRQRQQQRQGQAGVRESRQGG